MPIADPSRPIDARARRSRDRLQLALLTLLETRPFDDISVRDITGAAEVSYPTFFRNYQSKAELLGDIGAREMHDLFAVMIAVLDRRDPGLTARAVCDFVDGRRHLWTLLVTSEAVFAMRQVFVDLARDPDRVGPRTLPEIPIELSASFFFGSMLEVLSWWLRQPGEVAPGETAHHLETLVMRPTMTRYGG